MVTDMGLVTASGVGVEPAWRCVLEGQSCIGPVRSFDSSSFPAALGAELHEVPQVGVEDDERSIRCLLAAADTLTTGLTDYHAQNPDAAKRTAVVLGTSKGVVLAMAGVHRRAAHGGGRLSAGDLKAIEAYRPGYGTSRLARRLGARPWLPRSTTPTGSGHRATSQDGSLVARPNVERRYAHVAHAGWWAHLNEARPRANSLTS